MECADDIGLCTAVSGNRKRCVFVCGAGRTAVYRKNLSTGNNLFVSCGTKQTGNGFLDDYAFYTAALLGLYEASKDDSYLKKAESFCREAIDQFADEKNGGFYLIGKENEPLVLAPKETYDGAMPCGNSIMAYNLVRISQLTNNSEWEQIAQRQLAFLSGQSADYPGGT